MPKTVVLLNSRTNELRHAQATKAANLVFISGQVALDSGGQLVGTGNCQKQTEQVFRNLEFVIKAAGGELTDVVKITCFLVNADDLAAYYSVRSRVFPVDPPASSTVVVRRLGRLEFLLEVEAIAVLG